MPNLAYAQSSISPEELLNWENRTEPYISDALPQTNIIAPPPRQKPVPPENFTSKTTGVQLSGRAGPAMPAVPPGNVKVEVIDHIDMSTAPASRRETNIALDVMQNVPPLMTFVFNNKERLDLDPYQRNILKEEIGQILHDGYQGRIRVYSYAHTDENEPATTHQMAINRAVRLRSTLLKYGLPADQLDVRAINNPEKGNVIHIYLSTTS